MPGVRTEQRLSAGLEREQHLGHAQVCELGVQQLAAELQLAWAQALSAGGRALDDVGEPDAAGERR